MDTPLPSRYRWGRRHILPALVIGFLLLARLALYCMPKFDILMDLYFDAFMWYQFLIMGSVLILSVWFVFLSGYKWWIKALGAGFVIGGIAGLVLFTHDWRFDGQMEPTWKWSWEPTDDELLRKHLENREPSKSTADPIIGPSDSPQFRGILGDGSTPGVTLSGDWSATPPKVLWRHPVGGGHAGIAVAGNSVITMEQRSGDEVVVCYDRATGFERWAYSYSAKFEQTEPMGGSGPRITPTIADEQVFTLGAKGTLTCLNRFTGTMVWQADSTEGVPTAVPEWGYSGSPVVWNDLVIVNTGTPLMNTTKRAILAYHRKNGEVAWRAGSDPAAYASPQIAKLNGKDQLLVFDFAGLGGYDPKLGSELFRYPWSTPMGMNSAQPILVDGNRLFVSSEVSNGGALLSFTNEGVQQVWKNRALSARYASPVLHKGHLFGLSNGLLVCVEVKTGKRKYAEGDFGNGQIVRAGDHLVITGEKGKIFLVAADTEEFNELGRFDLFKDRTWNMPALAGKQLFVRNHREIACVELP